MTGCPGWVVFGNGGSSRLVTPMKISHTVWPFGKGSDPTRSLGDKNDHHGYSPRILSGMILQVVLFLVAKNGPSIEFNWANYSDQPPVGHPKRW